MFVVRSGRSETDHFSESIYCCETSWSLSELVGIAEYFLENRRR